MGEYEDRYPDSYGRGEAAAQESSREELKHGAEPPRQVRDAAIPRPPVPLADPAPLADPVQSTDPVQPAAIEEPSLTAAGVEPANTGAGPAPAWQHKPSIPGQQSVADQRSAQDGRRTPAAAPLPRQSGGYQGVSFRGVGPRGYHRSAERIYEDICDRLTENPFIDASDVEVTVSGGEVVLSGSIDSAISTYQVESIAREAPGVAVVRNNLSVRYGEETSVPAAGAGIDPTPEETRR